MNAATSSSEYLIWRGLVTDVQKLQKKIIFMPFPPNNAMVGLG